MVVPLTARGRKIWLKEALRREPILGRFSLELPETESRAARKATVVLRSMRVATEVVQKSDIQCGLSIAGLCRPLPFIQCFGVSASGECGQPLSCQR